jgi:endonuclease/exonuclease/phosphatase family metal-dependent hydrolase
MSRPGKTPLLQPLCLGLLALGLSLVHAETLTVATYNIENYGPADRVTEEGYRKDYPKPEGEKRALRTAIRALKADVLVLQEMGGQPYLDELQRDLKGEGLDYPFAALATASDADRHVAMLSRRPLKSVTTHTDLEFAYFSAKENVKRGLLEATVTTAAGDLTIFALHLKSRFTERPDDPLCAIRRAGEATAIRDAVLKKFPMPAEARFLILGDCNDSKSSKALEHLEKRGKTEIATLLPAADPRGDTWTHDYHHEDTYTRVDHILVSPALRAAVQGGTAQIFDGEGVRASSDHRPVIVTLVLEPKK